MLSKIVGPTVVLTLSGTAQTVTPTTFAGNQPKVVRIAAGAPAFINFNTTATTSTGILVPNGTAEHFKLENSSYNTTGTTATFYLPVNTVVTATISVLQAGSGGTISITPVA